MQIKQKANADMIFIFIGFNEIFLMNFVGTPPTIELKAISLATTAPAGTTPLNVLLLFCKTKNSVLYKLPTHLTFRANHFLAVM